MAGCQGPKPLECQARPFLGAAQIEQVVEVKYGSTLNGRFREVTKVLRWRPDKAPADCDFDQLDEPAPVGLDEVLSVQPHRT